MSAMTRSPSIRRDGTSASAPDEALRLGPQVRARDTGAGIGCQRQNLSKTRGASSAVTPGPWSRTETSPFATLTSTSAPGGLHLAALSTRFVIARATRTFTPVTVVGVALTAKRTLG